jgi:hypothetical protein
MLEPPVCKGYNIKYLADKRRLEESSTRRGFTLHWLTKEEMQSLANNINEVCPFSLRS